MNNHLGPEDQAQSDNWGLVLPFIACESKGGPYEDVSYVAGFQTGTVYAALGAIKSVGGSSYGIIAYRTLGAQLDLIAMHHGFTIITHQTMFSDEHGIMVESEHWMYWQCSLPEGTYQHRRFQQQ